MSALDTDSAAMLQDLFGTQADLRSVAKLWNSSGMHAAVQELGPAPHMEQRPEAALWVRLTRALQSAGRFPIGSGETSARRAMNLWSAGIAADLAAVGVSGRQCAETGDGHFLRRYFGGVCAATLSLDKFDPAADVRMDLNLPPAMAPASVQAAKGTVDLLVSNQVFEHLQHPTIAMADLNAMLRTGGQLVFSVPFLIQDHSSSETMDYFRYTVRNVHALLKCGGFEVRSLKGLGGRLGVVSYLAGVPAEDIPEADIAEVCDGLATDFCSNRFYTVVAAVGAKKRDVPSDEIRACFG